MKPSMRQQRLAWALTGSGHFFTECVDLMREISALVLFVTRAAADVERLKDFEDTAVVESLDDLRRSLATRMACVNA